ncbi:MAG: hypothetical protein AMXMBFR84_03840 [Candidatus Hydrogenedentota bacterium]
MPIPFSKTLLYLVSCALTASAASACTIFVAAKDGAVIAANNEDFYLDVTPKLWITAGENGDYGRVCVGFAEKKRARPFAQGGMNEVGLFFDAAVIPPEPEPKDKKPKPPENMGDRMLAECGTVEEAIAWLGQFNLKIMNGGHFLIADRSGAAAVVELVDGELKSFPKTKDYIGVTNFAVADPSRGNFPCPRFAALKKELTPEATVTPEFCRDVLNAVAVPRTHDPKTKRDGGTLYSNVCDLKNGVVYLYRESRFDKPVVIDVAEHHAKGTAAYDMDDLFEKE